MSVPRTETRRLVGASASSMLREGDWSHVRYLIAIIVIFSVSRTMVNTYKFCKKEILIQPPGEPTEQYLGDVKQKSLIYTKFHK